MESNGNSHIPITESDLALYSLQATQLINKVRWKPGKTRRSPQSQSSAVVESAFHSGQEDEQSLLTIARAISEDAYLLTDAANHTMRVIKGAICLAYHVAGQYNAASGTETLSKLNAAKRLSSIQVTEFQEKTSTAAAAAVFTMASYVEWALSSYETEKVSALKMLGIEIPEVNLLNYIKGIEGALYYFALHVTKSGEVKTDIQLVKAAILYFQSMVKEVKFREASQGHKEYFENVSYRLVDTGFILKGFNVPSSVIVVTNEFNTLKFEEIVGNRLAKHAAARTAQRLVCYDRERRENPFSVIGGFHTTQLGYGFPGTGKSMQIAATATLIDEYCKRIGLPFIFNPIPQALVSTYQGGSAERMELWMSRRNNTEAIVYMPIDDAENVFKNRTHEGVSSGVLEVISVFLNGTEGASAPKYGNSVVALLTNLPELIDPAVMSRVSSRFTIDGAVTVEDFLDQDFLWWKSVSEVDAEFINMKDPKTYKYLANQRKVSSVAQLNVPLGEVSDDRIKLALAIADKKHDRREQEFFATLYREVKDRYPTFTSRDVRNIQQAVSSRVTDFDLPEEWFERPEQFFQQAFPRKVEILKDLMRSNMKGLTFAEVRFEETIRYLGTLANIANIDRERRIAARMETMAIETIAVNRLKGQ